MVLKRINNRAIPNVLILAAFVLMIGACEDDSPAEFTGATSEYLLEEIDGSDITGSITFQERADNSTFIRVSISGQPANNLFNAVISANSFAQTGANLITLNTINSDGISETNVTAFNDGTIISYNDFLTIDAHVQVLSVSSLGSVVAAGDLGINELTGNSDEYSLDGEEITGSVILEERVSGESLITISMSGAPSFEHPSHIHMGNSIEGGTVVVSLNNLDGRNDTKETHIEFDDDENPITYDQLIASEFHVDIHLNNSDSEVIATSEIGQNAFTGQIATYEISELNESGVNGLCTMKERRNSTTVFSFEMTGTMESIKYGTHLHDNSLDETGEIAIWLLFVDGNDGRSNTQVEELADGTPITFQELTQYDGYLDLHVSALGEELVAGGNMGLNIQSDN